MSATILSTQHLRTAADVQKAHGDQVIHRKYDVRSAMTDLVAVCFMPSEGGPVVPNADPVVESGLVTALSLYRTWELRDGRPFQRVWLTAHKLAASPGDGRLLFGGPTGRVGLWDLSVRPVRNPQNPLGLSKDRVLLWQAALAMDRAVEATAAAFATGRLPDGVEMVSRFTWPRLLAGFPVDFSPDVHLTPAVKDAAVRWARAGGGDDKFLTAPRTGYVADVQGIDLPVDSLEGNIVLDKIIPDTPAVVVLFSAEPGGKGDMWAVDFPRRGFQPHPALKPGTRFEAGARLGDYLGRCRPTDWNGLVKMIGEAEAVWLAWRLVEQEDRIRHGLRLRRIDRLAPADQPAPECESIGQRVYVDLGPVVRRDGLGVMTPVVQVAFGAAVDLLGASRPSEVFDLYASPEAEEEKRAGRKSPAPKRLGGGVVAG